VVARDVVAGVRRFFRRLADDGLAVSFGVVFGSQATGEADDQSDIDLVVVSPRFDGPVRRDDVHQLWRVAARTDSRIEPIPCGERQWDEDTSSALIEIARRHGTTITPADED
jgi:hypothetical protein